MRNADTLHITITFPEIAYESLTRGKRRTVEHLHIRFLRSGCEDV